MSEPFLAEIRMFSFGYAPQGWAACDGAILPINQNQALFSLLGTTYGGNGTTTFALPDLRGRVPVHFGNGVTLGQSSGQETHVLTVNEMPAHVHIASGSSTTADQKIAAGNVWATSGTNPYAATPNLAMSNQAISTTGQSQAHENRQPYLPVMFCIATMGIYPSRN
ncbi:MAG TPA: tail fiber protein [Symbiobacteriaceae bacterium]|nr:tail fiber protein [Symbiobacteriaceae bacterium]